MAIALVVVCSAAALVLNRLWVDAARVELSAAAEAAALAAAAQLADDDLLCDDRDSEERVRRCRAAAADIAARNRVAGRPVQLDVTPGGDIRVGRRIRDAAGNEVFLETNVDPTIAAVFAARLRSRGDPLALLFRGLTGCPDADVVAGAEASIDGRIVGVRPFAGANVPCVPLAILEHDGTDARQDTWTVQIEQRLGADEFGFDTQSGLVIHADDGIPEITLKADPADVAQANMHWIHFGSGLPGVRLAEQIHAGLSTDDLIHYRGELRFDSGPLPVTAAHVDAHLYEDALRGLIGEPRICLLYVCTTTGGPVTTTRLVAIRIMAMRADANGRPEIVVQPSVISTRTALIDETADPNPYIYKLHLTGFRLET